MNNRQRIKAILAGEKTDGCGFWLGNPLEETMAIYLDYFKMTDEESLRRHLGDNFRWICPQWTCWKHPEGKSIFDWRRRSKDLTADGFFANCESLNEIDKFDWPDPAYYDFTESLNALRQAGDTYRASGMWTCFFHDVANAFGMENYFIKMYTNPAIVEAVTDRVCEFYLKANELFFEQAEDLIDGFFLGNDLGTQLDLQISPELFDRFLLPWFKKFTEQGHAHGYQVILHSCGAISKIIDRLIDIGVDAIHPLQAKAQDMDAQNLADKFGGRIAFIGGIDTQELLVNGTPDDIRQETLRVKEILGQQFIVSPSHEALLPNVPPENVLAMALAAQGR